MIFTRNFCQRSLVIYAISGSPWFCGLRVKRGKGSGLCSLAPLYFLPPPSHSTTDCANSSPMGEGRGEGPPGLAQKNVLVLANRASPRPTTPYVDTYGAGLVPAPLYLGKAIRTPGSLVSASPSAFSLDLEYSSSTPRLQLDRSSSTAMFCAIPVRL